MPRKGTKLSPDAQARQDAAVDAWHKENTEILKFSVRVRKGCGAAYKELAKRRGCSLTALIRDYLNGECEKENISV